MRLIDADALERMGYVLTRTYQQDKETMVYETKKLSDVPTAQPQRKTGRWKPLYDNIWICTNCEQTEQFGVNIESTSDYCPSCGARMDGESE